MLRINDLTRTPGASRSFVAACARLGGAGLGEFHGKPQVNLVQDRVQSGVTGFLGQSLGRGASVERSTLPPSSPTLSESRALRALRPLATACYLCSVESSNPLQDLAGLAFGQFDQPHHLQSIDVVGPGGEDRGI